MGGCGNKRTRLYLIPDDLLEEAAKRMFRAGADMEGNKYPRRLARAALSVLFPDGEEE